MSDWTTVSIKKTTKNKLEVIKSATGLQYDEIINNLLDNQGGENVDDVITIHRDSIAFNLKYWEFNNPNIISRDISYQELKIEPVGTKFIANDNPAEAGFVNCSAEIVFKKGDDVVLLVKEFSKDDDGVCSNISSVVHVNTF